MAAVNILSASLTLQYPDDPCCPEIRNRKFAFKGTNIPVVETFIINPLECTHTPRSINAFKGGIAIMRKEFP